MAKYNGTTIILNANGAAIAHVENSTLSVSRELADANDKDSAPFADHLDNAGLKSWEISFDGNADWTATTGNADVLFDLVDGREAVAVIFGVTDGRAFSGDASFTNVELGAPMEETASISGSATGQGALTKIIFS